MTTYLEDAMTRLVDMEQQVISGSTAVKYPHYAQEDFPYWTNNFTEFRPGRGDDEFEYDYERRIYVADIRYIIGHITEGYKGQPQEQFWADWPAIQDFFAENPGLTSTTYTTPLRYLDPQETVLLPSAGLVRFQNSGIGADQVGGQIRLELVFDKAITRD